MMTGEDIRKIISDRLIRAGEHMEDSFETDYVDKPDTRGVFLTENGWFIYESDEKNVKFFTGPFADGDIVYACAKMLHKSEYFEDYRFSDEARRTYIHTHYRSLKEIGKD